MGNEQQQPITVWPLVAPSNVTPAPVPTSIGISRVRGSDGRSLIVLQFVTQSGVGMYFLENQAAIELSKKLQELATGIVVASAADVPRA